MKAVELAIVNGTITEEDAKSIEENNDIKTGLIISTQEKYKDKLNEALRHQIDVSDKLSNEKTKADYKVNGKKGINREAITDANVARLKQAELDAGVVVSSTEEAKELMSTTSEAVARKADTVNVAKENAATAQSTISSIIKQKKSGEKAVAPSQEDIKATIKTRQAAHNASKTDAKPQVQPQTQRSTDTREALQTGADMVSEQIKRDQAQRDRYALDDYEDKTSFSRYDGNDF